MDDRSNFYLQSTIFYCEAGASLIFHHLPSNKMNVLGIKIDDLNEIEALQKVEEFLQDKKQRYIVTPNPEIIMAVQKDPDLKEILNKADLSLPDGVGLKLSGIKNRITGVDFMHNLIRMAANKGYSVGFIGGKKGVAKKAAEVFKKEYPNLKVTFAEDGGEVDRDGVASSMQQVAREKSTGSLTTHYSLPATDIIFVAFGHGKQEKWIARYLSKIPVKVAMTVGGSLDYVVGEVRRAPKPLRDLGLEWLFRLILQPWRIKRQMALLKYIYYISMKT